MRQEAGVPRASVSDNGRTETVSKKTFSYQGLPIMRSVMLVQHEKTFAFFFRWCRLLSFAYVWLRLVSRVEACRHWKKFALPNNAG